MGVLRWKNQSQKDEVVAGKRKAPGLKRRERIPEGFSLVSKGLVSLLRLLGLRKGAGERLE